MVNNLEDIRFVLLENAMKDAQKQLGLLSDLCVNMVRAYTNVRDQHADLAREFSILCSILKEVGVMPSKYRRSQSFMRLFEEPHVAGSILLSGGAETVGALCAVSLACMCSISENVSKGSVVQLHTPRLPRVPVLQRPRPRWPPTGFCGGEVGWGTAVTSRGGGGSDCCSSLSGVMPSFPRRLRIEDSLVSLLDWASLQRVRVAARAFYTLPRSSFLEPQPPKKDKNADLLSSLGAAFAEQSQQSSRHPGLFDLGGQDEKEEKEEEEKAEERRPGLREDTDILAELLGEEKLAHMDSSPGSAFAMSRSAFRAASDNPVLALLQDVWQYPSLADSLTCAMEHCSIRQFRMTSRAGRECMRFVSKIPDRPRVGVAAPPLLVQEPPGRGIMMLLDETWRFAVLTELLASSMGQEAVLRFSAISRAGREVMRGDCSRRRLMAATKLGQSSGWKPRRNQARLMVRLHGLSQKPELNGMVGMLVHPAAGDRCHVILTSGERIRVRRSHFEVLGRTELCPDPPAQKDRKASHHGEGQPDATSLQSGLMKSSQKPSDWQRGAICVCGGTTNSQSVSSSFYCFLPASFTWRALPPLPGACSHPNSAMVDSRFYVFGGHNQDTVLDSAHCFDPEEWAWERLPKMPRQRSFATLAVMGSDIYVAGGCDRRTAEDPEAALRLRPCRRGGAFRAMERFSTKTKTWTTLPSMLQSRTCATMSPMGGSLYICGGCNENEDMLGDMERFNPKFDVWHGIFSAPWKSAFSTHAVHKDYLYLCGGGQNENSTAFARFHHVLATWERLPPMMHGRMGHSATATPAGDIVVCGGCVNTGSSAMKRVSSVECYRPALGFWENFHCAFPQHSFAGAVTSDGHLYVLGGKDMHGVTAAAERMNLQSGTWEAMPPIPEALIGSAYGAIQPSRDGGE